MASGMHRQPKRRRLLAVATGLLLLWAGGLCAFEVETETDAITEGARGSRVVLSGGFAGGAMLYQGQVGLGGVSPFDVGVNATRRLPRRISGTVAAPGANIGLLTATGDDEGKIELVTFAVAVPNEYRSLLDRRVAGRRPTFGGPTISPLMRMSGSVLLPMEYRNSLLPTTGAPSERVYGVAIPEMTDGSMKLQYGVVGRAPSGFAPGWDTDRHQLLRGTDGPAARWTGVALGDGDNILRGHYRTADVDGAWTPSSGQGGQGVVAGMAALGFAGKNDLFDSGLKRTQATQFAGNKFSDLFLEAEPVHGLAFGRRQRTQEIVETGDTATDTTLTARLDAGLTHFAYTTNERDIQRTPDEEDPEREAHTTAYADILDLSQGLMMNGTQAVVGFTRSRQHSVDNLTEEETPEHTQTLTRVDQLQLMPFLNLGYQKAVTEVDDEETPTSIRTTYALNELKLNDHAKLQASLVRDDVADSPNAEDDGMKREVLTVRTPKDERMWLLTDRIGVTNAVWQTETNEAEEVIERRSIAGDANLFGFAVTGSYSGEHADFELNPTDRTATEIGISREISSTTRIRVAQSQAYEWGAPTARRRMVSATQSIGGLAVTMTHGVLETASGAERPESALEASFREDKDSGLRGGLTIVDHADTDKAHGLLTKEARASLPLGPVTLRGALRENPRLANNGKKLAVDGEQKVVGLAVPIGPVAFSFDRVENPTMVSGKTEKLLEQTASDFGITAQLGQHGSLSIRDRMIEYEEDRSTNSLEVDLTYEHDDLGLLSLAYVRNWADGSHGDLPLGDGYRVQYSHDISDDARVEFNVAKSFASIARLTEGLPDRDTRVFFELDVSF